MRHAFKKKKKNLFRRTVSGGEKIITEVEKEEEERREKEGTMQISWQYAKHAVLYPYILLLQA